MEHPKIVLAVIVLQQPLYNIENWRNVLHRYSKRKGKRTKFTNIHVYYLCNNTIELPINLLAFQTENSISHSHDTKTPCHEKITITKKSSSVEKWCFPNTITFDLLVALSQRRLDLMIFGIGKYLTSTLPLQTIAIYRMLLSVFPISCLSYAKRKWFSQNL